MDPAQLLGMVPEKDRAAVSKEIADAKEFIQGRKHLLDTFDKVAKLNTVANLANPTVQRASQVEALTNTASIILGKLVGTGALSDDERAAMLKAFASIADRKEAVASKRANIISIMDQKRPATPLFKATTGMDLDRFQSTSVPVEAQYKTVNGVRYMRGPNGEAIPVK
jgi:septum formation inhibitor MinC